MSFLNRFILLIAMLTILPLASCDGCDSDGADTPPETETTAPEDNDPAAADDKKDPPASNDDEAKKVKRPENTAATSKKEIKDGADQKPPADDGEKVTEKAPAPTKDTKEPETEKVAPRDNAARDATTGATTADTVNEIGAVPGNTPTEPLGPIRKAPPEKSPSATAAQPAGDKATEAAAKPPEAAPETEPTDDVSGDRRQEREERIAAIKERNEKRRQERLTRLAERNPEMAERVKQTMAAAGAEDPKPSTGEGDDTVAPAPEEAKPGTPDVRNPTPKAPPAVDDSPKKRPREADRAHKRPERPTSPARRGKSPGTPPKDFLDISHLLTLGEVRETTGDPKLSMAGALSGLEINPHYNNAYFAPPRRKNFGVSLQVWREEVRREANKRYQRMRRQFPNAEDTNALTLKGFFSYWGDIMSLTFLDFTKRTLVSIACSQDVCTTEELFKLAMTVKDRL